MIRFQKALVTVILIVTASASLFFGDKSVKLQSYLSGFRGTHVYTPPVVHLSYKLFAIFILFVFALKYLWNWLSSPLIYECDLVDTVHENKREKANDMRRRRKIGDLPPVYPNGWFFLTLSIDLPVKEVKNVQVLGEHLVLFRGEDGSAHVLDAYCPHLGANISIGGVVKGNCIQCPFHGWCFEGYTGTCVDIPYSDTVPQFAKIKSWNSIEINGRIYVWYHAEDVEPEWMPEELECLEKWKYCGQTIHYVNCHIEDIPENGADLNHFNFLHTPFVSAGRNLNKIFKYSKNFVEHEWVASWRPLEEEEKHCSELTLVQKVMVFGYHLPFLDVHISAKQIGPGIVHMKLISMFGDVVIIQEVTPVEPLLQKLTQTCYTSSLTFFGKLVLYAEAIQLERDVMIWNHKTYISKPLLVKEDNEIKKHRQWFSQFFSKNSPRLTMSKKDILEW